MSHYRTRLIGLVVAACAILPTGDPALAQLSEPTAIAGHVIDARTGAGVMGAEVVHEGPTERTVLTGSDGSWSVEGMREGLYTITVTHPFFASRSVDVSVGTSLVSEPSGTLEVALTPRPVLLDQLVVTGGRRLERLGESVVSTILISRAEIEETGASDLASVLIERAGVELQEGHPTGSGVMIQGLGSERVLVLVDGQPFIGRVSGQVDLSRIPTAIIERIEIAKGPQSTLYGSEAMGGVVNVITRSPEGGLSGNVRATVGGQGRLDVGVGVNGEVGPLGLVADLGRRSVELTPGLAEDAGQRAERWDLATRLGWRTPVDGLRAEAGVVLLTERQRWRAGQLYQFADNVQWTARVGMTLLRGPHHLSATGFSTVFDRLTRRATSSLPIAGTGTGERQAQSGGEVVYGRSLGAHAIDLGIRGDREEIRSDNVSGVERSAATVEAFAQVTLAFGPMTLVPGVRATTSEPWGTHWTNRVAALFRPSPGWSVRISGAEGFRAPDSKERFFEFLHVGPGFGYTVRGNPELGPELSRNVTTGIEWAGMRTYLRAELFHNAFDDFIETRAVGDSSGVTVYTYGNIDDGFTRGADVEVGVTRGGLRLNVSQSWLQAERRGTGEPLLGRPEWSSHAVLSFARPGGTRVALTGTRTGRTAMERAAEGIEWREPILRFDVRIAQELRGGLTLTLGSDNFLAARADRWPGFADRHLYLGVSWSPFGGT